jgi:hypothetical protein
VERDQDLPAGIHYSVEFPAMGVPWFHVAPAAKEFLVPVACGWNIVHGN